jgi:putative ABC transport system permease protein
MRSILTTLGIVIGIVTVTLMGTAIEALDRAFLKTISFIGADVLYVQRNDWGPHSEASWREMQKRRELTVDDAALVERHMSLAQAVTPVSFTRRMVKAEKRNARGVTIVGSTDQLLYTGGISVAKGRFLTTAEAEGGRPVCVLGSEAAENLFRNESPLEKKVTIDGRPYEIVGVLEKQGVLKGDFDNQLIIPLPEMIATFRHSRDVEIIEVKVKAVADLDDAREDLRNAMRRARHLAPADPDDFAINEQSQVLAMVHRVTGTIAAVGLFITGLSLFVGGIGIMNIMFVSVAERTREIGIRKAIGAKRRTILLQFLIEAATICLLGGGIGLSIAWPVTLFMQKFMPAILSLDIVGIALGVSLVTGVLSGFFPAWRAARMDPVEALRNE